MKIVKCKKCKKTIFKYQKIGTGRLWHCWNDRIIEDYSTREGNQIKCPCGQLIGIEEKKWIKMKQNAFELSGNITK
ncbi:hypothetical protein JW964_14930 [candidate division KSB1 bacterium]|nr:hypothetical protein [candidate division KSB1 bacterium]